MALAHRHLVRSARFVGMVSSAGVLSPGWADRPWAIPERCVMSPSRSTGERPALRAAAVGAPVVSGPEGDGGAQGHAKGQGRSVNGAASLATTAAPSSAYVTADGELASTVPTA